MHQYAISCIVPPHILKNIATKGTQNQKTLALSTLKLTTQMSGQRQALTDFNAAMLRVSGGGKDRVVYNAEHGLSLPGVPARKENDSPSPDVAVNEAYDGSGITYDLFKDVYQRNSLDNNGMRIDATVHYQKGFGNAFWNGEQMIYGDGDADLSQDERLFNRFTIAIDAIGHELTHGITQFEAKLTYNQQPGALNESMSDVFGSLVKQYSLHQTAAEADWIIGAGLLTANVNGVGIRSLKAPGTAYDDPVLGKDPQPAHMKDYVNTISDNGGVHINSGIPNRVFYITAMELGGYAWEKVGMIWYVTLRDRLTATSKFQDCANLTYQAAGELFGSGSLEQQAVKRGWAEVGLSIGSMGVENTAPSLWSLFGRTRKENIGERQTRAKRSERLEFTTPLPAEIVEAIENSEPDVRSRAVLHLANLLNGQDPDLAQAAKAALEKIADEDDSIRVSQEAEQTLETFRQGGLRAEQNLASEQQTGEPAELTAEQIAEREVRLQAAIAANIRENNRSQPVFNDKAQGEDQLGIKDEVEALSQTLLLRDVEPPVAVGVMGGWGSGKSFVMYLIDQYVRAIRAQKVKKGWADGDEKDPKIPAFVGHVYQIHFNAWTYAKSNLWASLMDTIFTCLNRQMQLERLLAHREFSPENSPTREQIRDSMMAGGDEFKKIYLDNPQLGQDKDLEKWRKNLEHWSQHLLKGTLLWNIMRGQQVETLEKLKDTEEQLNQLKSRREQFEKDRPPNEITAKDLDPIARKAYLQSIKNYMMSFLSNQLSTAAKEELKKQDVKEEDVQKYLEEAKGLWGGITTLVTAFRRSKLYLIWTLIFFALTFALPYVWVTYDLEFVQLQVAKIISWFLTLLPTLAVLLPWIKKSMEASVEAKKILEGAYVTQQAKHAEEIANATDKPLPQKISELQADISRGSVAAYDALIGLLEAQAEEQRQKIGPSAKYSNLMEFVQSRLDAATYENQLGLMHQVRQDIDELTFSLVDNASPEFFPRGKPRVILYIDDLDRCPPPRVVEMLEAVQLLLNTKLFIVVLGLDTRYVTRALEKEYKEILQHEGDPSGLDYIEKIIQIPYRVRAIEKDNLRQYIEKQMDIEKGPAPATSTAPPVQTIVTQDSQPDQSQAIQDQLAPIQPPQYPPTQDQPVQNEPVQDQPILEQLAQEPSVQEQPTQDRPLAESKVSSHSTEPVRTRLDIQQDETPQTTSPQPEPQERVSPPIETKLPELPKPLEIELPAAVIQFKQEDLEDLASCCQTIVLTPRSIKRLVNVFKLMKIFWFRADKDAGIAERDRPRAVKQAAMILLALSSAYPEVMREVFVHMDVLYRQGQEKTELFTALNNIKLPTGSASELSWQLQKYKADIKAFTAIAGNGQDKFGQLTLQDLKLSTFNIVRSFSFVGDPVYWTNDGEEVKESDGHEPQQTKARRNSKRK